MRRAILEYFVGGYFCVFFVCFGNRFVNLRKENP